MSMSEINQKKKWGVGNYQGIIQENCLDWINFISFHFEDVYHTSWTMNWNKITLKDSLTIFRRKEIEKTLKFSVEKMNLTV